MTRRDELCDHIADLLSPLGEVRYRFMFGGWGFYVDDRMAALVADGVLYLKADDGNRAHYEALGMAPFRPYPDRDATMSYHAVPADLLDDPESLLPLARSAVEAAGRAPRRRRR